MEKIIKKIQRKIEDYYYLVFMYSSEGQLRIQRLEKGGDYESEFNSYASFKKYQKKLRIKLVLFFSILAFFAASVVIIVLLTINILIIFLSAGLSLDEWKDSYKKGIINNEEQALYWENYLENEDDLIVGDDRNAGEELAGGSGQLMSFLKEWTEVEEEYVSAVYEIEGEKKFTYVYLIEKGGKNGNQIEKIQVATSQWEDMRDVKWNSQCEIYIDSATKMDTLLNSSCVNDHDKFLQAKVEKNDYMETIVIFSWEK